MAVNWGRLIVGVATGYISITSLRAAFGRTDEALKKLEQKCPGNDPKCRIVPAGDNIERRASYIASMSWKSSLDPFTRKIAMQTLNRKCDGVACTPPRDHRAEVKTLADAVYSPDDAMWAAVEGHFAFLKGDRNHDPAYLYRKDHYAVDQFSSAKRTLEYGGGDCDDATILLNALNMVSGFKTGMRIYKTKGASDWSHIAALVEIPPNSGKRHVLDASVDRIREGGKVKTVYPGWQAPKQMVVKYVDFMILPGGRVQKVGSGP